LLATFRRSDQFFVRNRPSKSRFGGRLGPNWAGCVIVGVTQGAMRGLTVGRIHNFRE
jgi:hypothetical protein